MKKSNWWILLLLVTPSSCYLGRGYQYLKSGYHYALHRELIQDTKTAVLGSVILRHESKRFGYWSKAPEYSTIILKSPGNFETVIYSAEANKLSDGTFRPFVESVLANENVCVWEDGVFKYKLRIDPLAEPEKEPIERPKEPARPNIHFRK